MFAFTLADNKAKCGKFIHLYDLVNAAEGSSRKAPLFLENSWNFAILFTIR